MDDDDFDDGNCNVNWLVVVPPIIPHRSSIVSALELCFDITCHGSEDMKIGVSSLFAKCIKDQSIKVTWSGQLAQQSRHTMLLDVLECP